MTKRARSRAGSCSKLSLRVVFGIALITGSCATDPRSAHDSRSTSGGPPDTSFVCPNGAVTKAPREVSCPKPPYPDDVRRLRIEGRVIVQAVVETDGAVSDVKVVKSPDPQLSKVTLATVRKWRYEPASCDGVPVRAHLTMTATFRLDW